MCFGMGCIRESESSGTCHDPSRCLMEARERAEEQAQGEAAANRLGLLRRAWCDGISVAVVDLETDSIAMGEVVYVGRATFNISFDDGDGWFHAPVEEIGRRVFLVAPWPADHLHAGSWSAGECPLCGESLEFFPLPGLVSCLGDCGFGHEIDDFQALNAALVAAI